MKTSTLWIEEARGLDPGLGIVLGMSWEPKISGTASELDKNKKSASVSSHNVCVFGERLNVFGSAAVEKRIYSQVQKKKVIGVSGALIFASMHPNGTAFLSVPLTEVGDQSEGRVWIAACNNGSPLKGFDSVISQDEVEARLNELQARYANVAAFGIEDNAVGWMDIVNGANFNVSDVQGQVKPLNASLRMALSSIPAPARIFLGIVGIVLLVQIALIPAWKYAYRLIFAEKMVQQDPNLLWQEAIDSWVETNKLPPAQSLETVLNAATGLQNTISAWNLKEVDCKISTGRKTWDCKAIYERKPNTTNATNASFLASIPKGWSVDWLPLNTANVSFEVVLIEPPVAMKLASLHKQSELLVSIPTALQKIEPALSDARGAVGPFSAVATPAPVFKEGGGVPKPQGVVMPTVSQIKLSGPARSFIDFASVNGLESVAWKAIALKISAESVKPNITASSYKIDLLGEVYAR